MITAGSLRERVEIVRPTRVPNDSGGSDGYTYTSILTTYAEVKQKKANTDIIASQSNIIQPFEFKIRYRINPVIKIADTIKWRDRTFEILSFDWDLMRTWITITAKTENESTSNGEV